MSRTDGITRREFVKGAALGAAGLMLGTESKCAPQALERKQPNLLFIQTDQQHFQAMSGLGCAHVRTPNMDRLLSRGVSFDMSYSANPVCCPARAAWYTGRPSSENGMLSNDHKLRPDFPDLGQWFRARSYEPVYAGKWHVPGRDLRASFRVLTPDSGLGEHCDPPVSRSAQAFLTSYAGDKPFFLSIGFLQPHDCCHWYFARTQDPGRLPYPEIERKLPPLPPNFTCDTSEPEALSKHMNGIRRAISSWGETQWRYYMWSYYRMVEMVDAQIGRVLDALEDSRFAEDTVVVLTADHGDGLARRHMVQKWYPYDEACRVPMAIVPPGGAGGRRDTRHVVSGLDLAPTLCDYAGIEAPPKIRGRSLRPLVEGKAREWREFVVSEMNITGRMLRTPECKLVSYANDPVEQLFDMRSDPWEMRNLATDARHADVLSDLKKRLGEWEGALEPVPGALA